MQLSLPPLALALALCSPAAFAMGQGDWRFVGPSQPAIEGEGTTIGRINIVAFDPQDPNTLYAGTPGSGLWRTQDDGANWTLIIKDIGISDVAIDPADVKIIYVMTGDGEGYDTPSRGVLKSVDGGATWQPTGLVFDPEAEKDYGHRLAMHSTDTKLLLAATTVGLLRTSDGGAHWDPVIPDAHVWDVLFHPTDPSIAYAATTKQVYRSTDFGATLDAACGRTSRKARQQPHPSCRESGQTRSALRSLWGAHGFHRWALSFRRSR